MIARDVHLVQGHDQGSWRRKLRRSSRGSRQRPASGRREGLGFGRAPRRCRLAPDRRRIALPGTRSAGLLAEVRLLHRQRRTAPASR